MKSVTANKIAAALRRHKAPLPPPPPCLPPTAPPFWFLSKRRTRTVTHGRLRRKPMTVCVAAIVPPGDAIITVSDFLFVGDGRSFEPGNQPKFQFVGPNNRWVVLYAGNDFSHFPEIIGEMRDAVARFQLRLA